MLSRALFSVARGFSAGDICTAGVIESVHLDEHVADKVENREVRGLKDFPHCTGRMWIPSAMCPTQLCR